MALPTDAILWKKPFDPKDIDARQVTGRPTDDPLLNDGEEVSSFEIALSAEAVALGVQVYSTGTYAPTKENGNKDIRMWFSVDDAFQDNQAFDDPGISVGVEVTIHTNSAPARRLQRTCVLKVRQL